MQKRAIISVVLGALLLFIWNAVSWMALPFHNNTLTNVPAGVFESVAMKAAMPESGVYHSPGLPASSSPEAMAAINKQLEEGPRITMMVYKNAPTKLFDPKLFLGSLFINFLTALLAYIVLAKIAPKNFRSVLTASILIGLVAALVSDISLMNWYLFPLDYTLVNVMDKVIAFGLLGVLFGHFSFKEEVQA